MSDILESLFQADHEGVEAISTNNLLSKVEDSNNRMREGSIEESNLMVGSLDVEALYPSIDAKRADQIVRETVTSSDLRVDREDWHWVFIYSRLTMTPHDKLDQRVTGVLPRRIYKSRRKPGKKPTLLTANL